MPHSIVLVSTQRGWRGGEHQAALLLRGLRDRGHSCRVVARANCPFAQRMEEDGFAVLQQERVLSFKSLRELRRFLNKEPTDILHSNDSHALTSSMVASFGLAIPVRAAARRVAFPINNRFKYRRSIDRLICTSNFVADVCRDSGIPDSQLSVVYDGVPLPALQSDAREAIRNELSISPTERMVTAIAAHTEEKGVGDLLHAVSRILPNLPDLKLVLAGDGPLHEALQQQANDAGIAEAVHFLGHRNDVSRIIQAADLMVLPSRQEGLGSSLIDGMLLGCPIVATTAGGIPELFASNGPPLARLVAPQQTEALAAAISSTLCDLDAARLAAEHAQRHAQKHFTDDAMVEATMDVYDQLLARRIAA